MNQTRGSRGKRWWIRRICVGMIGLHLSLLAYGAWVHSPTIDEVGHMAAGVSHWELGSFDLYRVNPPLVRLIAALPVSVVGYKMDWRGYSDAAGSRSEFYLGEKFAELNGERSFRLFALARLGSMVFSILGAVFCFLWARDLFGDASGVMALVLWCFSPMILGHGQMITPDVGATALGLAACYCFWRWLRAPDWDHSYLAGLVLGLAQLTKATMVLFFPLFPLLWLLWLTLSSPKSQRVPLRRSAAQLVLCLALALIVLNAGYGFEGTFQKLGDYRFVSESLARQSPRPSNRFADTWLAEVPVPLPVNYVMGVDTQKRDFEQGIRSYLRETWQPHGWWYYYLYGLLVKTPGGVLALAILAVAWATFCRRGRATVRDELFLAIPPTLIFVLVSSQTGFNHHLRYVLPVYPFLFVSMSRVAQSVYQRRRAMTIAWIIAGCCLIAGSLSIYPHSLSYFNELVGGPQNGSRHLVDSNIDWGQDLLYLRDWQISHAKARPLRLAYFGQLHPETAGIEYELPPFAKPMEVAGDDSGEDVRLEPGWYAISVSLLKGLTYRVSLGDGELRYTETNSLRYFEKWQPAAQAGYSIYIYHVTPEQAQEFEQPLVRP